MTRYYSKAQLPSVLRGSHDSRYVMDVFYDGERVWSDVNVYDVALVEDGTSKVQQSGSLTMLSVDVFGESRAPRTMEDVLSPFGTTITLYNIISEGPLFSERVSMGTFQITDTPDIMTTRWRWMGRARTKGDRIGLTFKDPFYKIQRNRFDVPGVTPSLTSVYAEIQRLSGMAITRNPLVADGPIPRALVYEEDRLDAIYELAAILDATPYVVSDGTLSLRPRAWTAVADEISAEDAEALSADIIPATYSAWVEQRRNYATDPRGTRTAAWSAALGNISLVTNMPGDIATAVRWTRTTAGAGRIGMAVGTTMLGGGASIRVQMRVRASEAMTVTVITRPTATSSTDQTTLASNIAVPAGVSTIDVTGATFSVATTATSGVSLTTSSGAVGATLDITAMDIELAAGSVGYLDGFSAGSPTVRHRFVGTLNASASVREVRTMTNAEQVIPRVSPRGTLIGVSRGMTSEGVYNRVVVRAQGQQAGVLAAREVTTGILRAQNADGSPSPFGRVPYFISSQFITTSAQAEAVAESNLPRLARPQAVVLVIEEVANPLRETGDVVRVRRQGETFLARVQGVTRSSKRTQITRVVMQDA